MMTLDETVLEITLGKLTLQVINLKSQNAVLAAENARLKDEAKRRDASPILPPVGGGDSAHDTAGAVAPDSAAAH